MTKSSIVWNSHTLLTNCQVLSSDSDSSWKSGPCECNNVNSTSWYCIIIPPQFFCPTSWRTQSESPYRTYTITISLLFWAQVCTIDLYGSFQALAYKESNCWAIDPDDEHPCTPISWELVHKGVWSSAKSHLYSQSQCWIRTLNSSLNHPWWSTPL
jgi:hypothetical protein